MFMDSAENNNLKFLPLLDTRLDFIALSESKVPTCYYYPPNLETELNNFDFDDILVKICDSPEVPKLLYRSSTIFTHDLIGNFNIDLIRRFKKKMLICNYLTLKLYLRLSDYVENNDYTIRDIGITLFQKQIKNNFKNFSEDRVKYKSKI